MNTEVFNTISWLHVLVAAIGYFLLGAIWYSALFQKQWISYTGGDTTNQNAKKGVGIIMYGSFLLMFICATGLSILIAKLHVNTWMGGLKLGVLTGVCFSITAISICYVYERKKLGLHLINGGYNLLGNIIVALILSCWN